MKRIFTLLLVLTLLFALCLPVCAATAKPSSMAIYVGGWYQSLQPYLIDGSNYFKLRDVAALLSETGSCFEVGYDTANSSISVTTGTAYTPVGGELAKGASGTVSCKKSAAKLTVDGRAVSCSIYLINGNNYFKLRDLAEAIGFTVGYDSATRSVSIDPAGYVPYEDNSGDYYTVQEFYNSNGDLTREEYCWASTGALSYSVGYDWNADGSLSKLTYYNEDGTIDFSYSYTYDAYGNLLTDTTFGPNGAKESTTDYKYDKDFNMTEARTTYWDGGSSYTTRTVYTVRSGMTIREDNYDEDGVLSYYGLYDYNSAGGYLDVSYRLPNGLAYYFGSLS